MKKIFKLPAYVGIILKQNNTVLMVQRHNTNWMSGFWNFPGGLLEEHETLLQAAIRETKEEVGITVDATSFKLVTTIHVHANNKNTQDIIGFYFLAELWHGEAINNEPHRHSEIGWYEIDQLPNQLTEHALLAIKALKEKTTYSESGW